MRMSPYMRNENESQPHDWIRVTPLVHQSYTLEKTSSTHTCTRAHTHTMP